MKKILLSVLMLTSLLIEGFSQILSPVIKTSTKINYAQLANIDQVVSEYIDKKWLIGTSVLVVKNNELVYYKGFGYADEASKKPMPANAIYRIMSQTKAITSLAILQLFEQGKIQLDQPVHDFIPSFKNQTVLKDFNKADTTYTTIPANRDITIRDLLTHTSGIDYADIGSEKMQAIYAKASIPSGLGAFDANLLKKMELLGKLPLVHQPGEKFTYGLNSDLLGCIVEIVSGKSLDKYMRQYIFEPLGMKDTYFHVPMTKADRLPSVYTENEKNQIISWAPEFRNIHPNYPLVNNTYFSGGAGLSATAFDYAIFLQMILNGGKYNGKQIISKRTAALMLSPQLPEAISGIDNFSLGFSITSAKSAALHMRSQGSFSWGGYYGTNYWADPKEQLIVLIMTQHTPNSHWNFKDRIENIIYGSLQ